MQLTDGSRVGVVGGGPAGSFFVLHLLRYARQRGIALRVTLFEGRDFSRPGPPGCARCAGLLSGHLQRDLRSFGLTLPERVIQSRADSYVLHLADQRAEVFPPHDHRQIVSVYRSRGPRLAPLPQNVNFDVWLLEEAQKAGATVIPAVVTGAQAGSPVTVRAGKTDYLFDLLVLANGVNSRRLNLAGFPYHPPPTEWMIQDEIAGLPGENRRVHVYFGHQAGVVFGATVPKGEQVNVSLLGKNLSLQTVDEFFGAARRARSYRRLCGCKSQVAVGPARGFYADRFVAVGDAAVTRLYKDGIGSAFRTARRAAHTAVFYGIGRADFRRRYAPLCRAIAVDNLFGRFLFRAWEVTARLPFLSQVWMHALCDEVSAPRHSRRCRLALWNMFTGDDSYRHILFSLLAPRTLWFLATIAWRLKWQEDYPQASC